MTNQESPNFLSRLKVLAELFDAKFSEAKATLYFEALKDLPLEAVIRALNQAVKSCTFMPRPAELRNFALGDSEDRAEAAWISFREAMKKAGSYASLSIMDAALGETIVAMFGSWAQACAQEFSPEMWSSKRKEFARVYHVMCQRNLSGSRYLHGICEQQNGQKRDWLKYVPVHRLDARGLSKALSLEEAEEERTQIATTSNGLTQLRDAASSALKLIPKKFEDVG